MIDRYEVTGRGHLDGWPGGPWDGRGSGDRFPWLWLAVIWLGVCVWPVGQRPHPAWKWNIYDHQREEWCLNPPTEHDIDAEWWVVGGMVLAGMSAAVLIAFHSDWLALIVCPMGILQGCVMLRLGYVRGGF